MSLFNDLVDVSATELKQLAYLLCGDDRAADALFGKAVVSVFGSPQAPRGLHEAIERVRTEIVARFLERHRVMPMSLAKAVELWSLEYALVEDGRLALTALPPSARCTLALVYHVGLPEPAYPIPTPSTPGPSPARPRPMAEIYIAAQARQATPPRLSHLPARIRMRRALVTMSGLRLLAARNN